jgi:hypothetical protein
MHGSYAVIVPSSIVYAQIKSDRVFGLLAGLGFAGHSMNFGLVHR